MTTKWMYHIMGPSQHLYIDLLLTNSWLIWYESSQLVQYKENAFERTLATKIELPSKHNWESQSLTDQRYEYGRFVLPEKHKQATCL